MQHFAGRAFGCARYFLCCKWRTYVRQKWKLQEFMQKNRDFL